MKLLIVESPGKIKELSKILGPDWTVKASVGHIRALANDGDHSLGFDLGTQRIDCRYIPRSDKSKQVISGLWGAVRSADQVFLATDPDREGETIAWHLQEELKLKKTQRVVYGEITDRAVKTAISQPRPLDQSLVDAGRCRDCLDKLVGYRGSPLVWRLNNGAKSVGRVQSATLHLLCQREQEIFDFKPVDYWSVYCDYSEGFRAFYHGGASTETSEPEIDDTGSNEKATESTRVLSQAEADRLVEISQSHPHQVQSIEGKVTPKKPPAAFRTSTLQQAAGSKLKFSPETTMSIAQRLYERGLITYMRTDSAYLSEDYCAAARAWLQAQDPDNVPDKVAKQKSKKGAQEAHEAIRPTDLSVTSASLKAELPDDEFQLFVLIWMRAMASQCKPALIRKTKVLIQSGEVQWQAKGQVVEFKGYSKYWNNISSDKQLPALQQQQPLQLEKAGHEQKQTSPPPRYTESTLVQLMEKQGIGRPSTYASTIKTLKQRTYIEIVKDRLQPTTMGLEVDQFMASALPELLQSDFTAEMETQLDLIAAGQLEWEAYLIGWNSNYFGPAIAKASAGLPAAAPGDRPHRTLEKSKTQCPGCGHCMVKVPTKSKKVAKGYFLKCDQGCTNGDRDLVMFWDKYSKSWVQPGTSSASPGDRKAPVLTEFPCPVCAKKLEQYFYTKEGQEKSMLRCSDAKARQQKKHEKAIYYQSKGAWWSPKYGNLAETALQE